ncbi:MAG: YceI family protein [Kofleriaceae bacterium]
MPRIDASTATCRVFTFKDGMLSAVAHDLELTVGRFTVDVDAQLAVTARFATDSVRVLHAVKDGRPTTQLSDGDKRKIEASMAADVLAVRRFPEATFAGQAVAVGDAYRVTGELTLHGKTRPLTVTTRAVDGAQVAEVTLHQPDFGIKPYTAMLGTLKVKADLTVRLTVPWSAA